MSLGHGGNVEEISRLYSISEDEIIDFSANINPLGISSKVKDSMIKALDKIERYPDITYYDVKNSISKFQNIQVENIILGNGAAEVIFNISRGLKPKNALIMAPTFGEYEDSLKAIDCNITYYNLKDDFKLDNEFISKIDNNIDIVFICNPNNPTGVLTSRDYLTDVLDHTNRINTIVVVDESFLDFVEDKDKYSVVDLTNKYSNLIVVKSLTKLFAFPGIRIGYGITSNKRYIEKIIDISIPWSINTVAAKGACTALEDSEYVKKTIKYVKEENDFLYKELSKFKDLNVYKGAVNFIFFNVKRDINLREELLKYGILIRSCNNYVNLDKSYYRVAVRTREENIKLINELKRIL